MNYFYYFIFLFIVGSMIGYVLELFYRRYKHKKWVNPGFLVGPFLPIYGFGLCTLTFIYIIFSNLRVNQILIILLMGLSMTLIEFIAGEIFIICGGVKLWDYSDRRFNYKGIVCPDFTFIWTVISAIYFYFLGSFVNNCLYLFNNNNSLLTFVLGIFLGFIIIDICYSTNILVKITRFAKENNFIVKYEGLKSILS